MGNPKDKPEEKQFTRRPPGKLLFQPPTPRPIPLDHPAKSLFSSLPSSDSAEEVVIKAEPETPTATPTVAPIITTTERATDTPTFTTTATPTIIKNSAVVETSLPRRTPQPPMAPPAADDPPRRNEALDSTHTSSEQLVYSYMYRHTISQNVRERHFGPKELLKATPIRSHVTVRKAIDGLIEKLSVEIVSNTFGSPFGPRYRVYDPREIMRRRQGAGIHIDQGSRRIIRSDSAPTVTPTTTPTETTTATPTTPTVAPTNSVGVTPTDSGVVTPTNSVGVLLNSRNSILGVELASAASSSKTVAGDDDDAFVGLIEKLKQTAREVTGRDPSHADAPRWDELGDVLADALHSAAARTRVSSAPAFLAAHLRQRLNRGAQPPAKASTAAAIPPAPAPEPPTDSELIDMFTGFLHQGMTVEDLDGQLSASIDAERWPRIRQAALERYEAEKGHIRPPEG